MTEDVSGKQRETVARDRPVLVAVDFSPDSEAALLWARDYANATGIRLVLLHVVHDPGDMPGYYSKLIKKKRAGRIQETAAEAFTDFMDRVHKAKPDLQPLRDAMRMMVVGLPVARILEVVDAVRPFTVVVGSQGRTGLKNVLIGSKAGQLVQLCKEPVTVVKSGKTRDDD